MKLRNLVNLKALKEEDFTHTPGLHQTDYSEQTPLEVQAHDDNQIYYIDPRDIETYIHGKMVVAMEKLGFPSKELTRDNSDATPGQMDDEATAVLEPEIDEGTCGYGKDGKIGKKPAGPHLREIFQRRAGIIK